MKSGKNMDFRDPRGISHVKFQFWNSVNWYVFYVKKA